MKVINFFGGPGVGKSRTSAGLFYELKNAKYDVEYITEYAKDLVWENRKETLTDQFYITAKQNRKLERLKNHDLQYVITDSPLLTGLAYIPENYYKNYSNLVLEIFNSYDNLNFLIKRDNDIFSEKGRTQNLDQAKELDDDIEKILNKNKIPYTIIKKSSALSDLKKYFNIGL